MNEVHAQERAMGGEGITVFEDRDFRGKSATYTRDVANLADSGLNDRISSLKVGPRTVGNMRTRKLSGQMCRGLR